MIATTPFAAAGIVAKSPGLASDMELAKLRPLTQGGPHVQVSFRIAFSEHIAFPRARTAAVVSGSEFNITLFAQEQAWLPKIDLGENIGSLWTGTACAATIPGRVFGLPVKNCTKAQFIEEVSTQIVSCESLNQLILEANNGRALRDFPIKAIEVWDEWRFSPEGISGSQPKWVNTTETQPHLPDQATSFSNLMLAGAHTRTEADVWSIEGAVESGRRAAQLIDPEVAVQSQYRPWILRIMGAMDDVLYRAKLPHVLDIAGLVFLFLGAGLLCFSLALVL